MGKGGLKLRIPGWGHLVLTHALFDLNGTLALDGTLSEAVRERLRVLTGVLCCQVITADTHGTAAEMLQGCGDTSVVRIHPGDEAGQKRALLRELGAGHTVALGNGANDALMLREARVGVCVLNGEGAALQAVLASDILVNAAEEALDLLLKPARLLAPLRR